MSDKTTNGQTLLLLLYDEHTLTVSPTERNPHCFTAAVEVKFIATKLAFIP
jgi:hypothetical protein